MKDLAASVGLWLHTASQVERAQSSMESAVASLAGTKSKTEKLDQELVSHVIGSLIDLCKTSQDRLASVPGLRELVCMKWHSNAACTHLTTAGAGKY